MKLKSINGTVNQSNSKLELSNAIRKKNQFSEEEHRYLLDGVLNTMNMHIAFGMDFEKDKAYLFDCLLHNHQSYKSKNPEPKAVEFDTLGLIDEAMSAANKPINHFRKLAFNINGEAMRNTAFNFYYDIAEQRQNNESAKEKTGVYVLTAKLNKLISSFGHEEKNKAPKIFSNQEYSFLWNTVFQAIRQQNPNQDESAFVDALFQKHRDFKKQDPKRETLNFDTLGLVGETINAMQSLNNQATLSDIYNMMAQQRKETLKTSNTNQIYNKEND